MDNKINIVFITDSNFVLQMHVAITSLIDSKKADSFYNIFVIAKDITKEQKENLQSLTGKNVEIHIIDENTYLLDLETNNINFPMVFWRLKLPEYFKTLNKIIHLDCDIIVQKDLSELFNTNIDNYYLAAVKDIAPTLYHAKENKFYSNYFNAGIMLLNLENLRQSNFFEDILELAIKDGDKYFFKEQDLLNDNIGEKIKLISYKYNFIASNYRYTKKQLKNFYNESIESQDFVIVHYAGKCRPWIYKYTYFSKQWNILLKQTTSQKHDIKLKIIPFMEFWLFLITQYKIYTNKKLYRQVGIL